jgi:hypothetical protein
MHVLLAAHQTASTAVLPVVTLFMSFVLATPNLRRLCKYDCVSTLQVLASGAGTCLICLLAVKRLSCVITVFFIASRILLLSGAFTS